MHRGADKEYIESNVWRCEKSPTGAHHYVESARAYGVFICKWCGEHRRFTIEPQKRG
jgi:RNase P subunit RPR2